jgi:hypothetical protein
MPYFFSGAVYEYIVTVDNIVALIAYRIQYKSGSSKNIFEKIFATR